MVGEKPWENYGNIWESHRKMGVCIVMGAPLDRWMVYFRENPNLKWMTAESTSIFFGNHHIVKSNVNDLIVSGEVRCHI